VSTHRGPFDRVGHVLGPLEERLMEVVWRSAGPLTVREVCGRHRGPGAPVYTTVMTTLDRLFHKGLLSRYKVGNAFAYRAAMTRQDVHRRIVEETVSALIERSGDPVLAAFVDAAASANEENLQRLEKLIAAKRRSKP
jgi:predicted transcriptional regulator